MLVPPAWTHALSFTQKSAAEASEGAPKHAEATSTARRPARALNMNGASLVSGPAGSGPVRPLARRVADAGCAASRTSGSSSTPDSVGRVAGHARGAARGGQIGRAHV